MNLSALRSNVRHALDLGIAGSIGAILGLYLYAELVTTESLWIRDGLAGAIVGGSIGYFLNAAVPLRDRAWMAFSRLALWGALTGALGGALGLLLGEWVLGVFQGGLLGRALGWTVLGLAIGGSQGLAWRSLARLGFGLIGGGLGGFVGGFLFETLRLVMGNRLDLGQGLGIVALGFGLGICLALVEQALRRAWVVVVNGRQEGRAYLLTHRSSRLGLDERAEVGLFGDATVDRTHAEIIRENGSYLLKPLTSSSRTCVNSASIVQATLLKDGDRITLGSTQLIFRRKGRG